MSEESTVFENTWKTISQGWWDFEGGHYAVGFEHDQLYLDFARKVERKIEELLPRDLTSLADAYARFRHVELDEVICDANRCYGDRMDYYHAALKLFKDLMDDCGQDVLDFALFIRQVESVVDPVLHYFKHLPDDYFAIPCSDQKLLFRDLHEVILSKLVVRLKADPDTVVVEFGVA